MIKKGDSRRKHGDLMGFLWAKIVRGNHSQTAFEVGEVLQMWDSGTRTFESLLQERVEHDWTSREMGIEVTR